MRSIAAGTTANYAVTDAGVVFSWCLGAPLYLDHGNRNVPDPHQPFPVAGLQGITVVSVSSGGRHTLVLAHDGSIYGFGVGKALGIGWGAGGEGYPPGFQGDPVDEAAGQGVIDGTPVQLTPKRINGLVCSVRHTN